MKKEVSKNYYEYVLSFGEAVAEHKKWEEMKGALTKKSELFDEKFEQSVQKQILSDYPTWKPAVAMVNRFSRETQGKFSSAILKVFNTVFKNVRSRQHEICQAKGANWKITVGNMGFGRRWNVRSEPIESWDDLVVIYNSREAVIAGLKAKKFTETAALFEKFCDALPELDSFSGRQITVDLPEGLCELYSEDSRSGAPAKYTQVSIRPRYDSEAELRVLNKNVTNTYGMRGSEVSIPLSKAKTSYRYDWTVQKAFMYYQLLPHIEMIVKAHVDTLKPLIANCDSTIANLKEAFGTQLLFDEL